MRVAEMIFQKLSRAVDTVFYLPGGGSCFLVDALGQSGLRAVCCLHEQGAGFAAVGYAMHHGLGVCLTTSGPGATNAITPCLAAWVDSVPVIFISGQVQTRWLADGQRSKGVQEGPTVEMVEPITKAAALARNAQQALYWIDKMLVIAREGRPGPCWLDVPQDVQAAEAVEFNGHTFEREGGDE